MATISMDLRVRIFDARAVGDTTAEVAERFAVSPAFVRRLMQRHRATGSLAPSTNPRGPQPRLAARAGELRRLAAEHPDLTPAEFRDRLGVSVSELTVWRMLRRLGLTFKKKSLRAAEQDRPDIQEARRRWPEAVAQRRAKRLIFLDETGFTTAMTRAGGCAPRGTRLTAEVPHGHWKTTTFVAGLIGRGLMAPMVLGGPMDAAAVVAYVEQVLAKEVRRGDLVILDNLSSHKTAGVRAALLRCRIGYPEVPQVWWTRS